MGRWRRTKLEPLVKSRRMTDGELIHLVADQRPVPTDDRDERIYESLMSVKSSSAKAIAASIVATALAILSYFGVLQRVSASGLEVSPVVFNHLALVALSLTTAVLSTSLSKQTFLQAWFTWKFKRGDSAERTQCLLLYPEAYGYFAFLRTNIGYPPHVFARATGWMQLVFILLLLTMIVIYLAGFVALWGTLAVQVWNSTEIDKTVSVLTVVSSATALVITALSPFYYDIPRTYTHYGLVNLLGKLEGGQLELAHRRIVRARIRMGLIDEPDAVRSGKINS